MDFGKRPLTSSWLTMKERAVSQTGGSKSFKDHVISADLHQQGGVCAFSEGDFKKGFTNVYAGLRTNAHNAVFIAGTCRT